MATLLDKLRKLFHLTPRTRPVQNSGGRLLDDATLTQLMQQVNQTQEGLYSCEETFALLDEYAELVVNGEDAAALMPLVEAHLRVCPDCGAEFAALRAILETD